MITLKPFRSKKYMAWVKTLPSCVSGKSPCDAHHIKVPGFGGTSKPSDLFVIPLTRDEHQEFHQIGWTSFEDKYNIDQLREVLKTIELAAQTGIIEVVGI